MSWRYMYDFKCMYEYNFKPPEYKSFDRGHLSNELAELNLNRTEPEERFRCSLNWMA